MCQGDLRRGAAQRSCQWSVKRVTFVTRIIFKVLCLIFKCLKVTAPSYLSDILLETHKNRFIEILKTKTAYGDHVFCRYSPIYWNTLPARLLTCATIDNFKAKLKHYIIVSGLLFKLKPLQELDLVNISLYFKFSLAL